MPVYELEVLSGLERYALEELGKLRGARPLEGLRFEFRGEPRALTRLRASTAVSEVAHFDVARPKALLGHQHLTRLARFVRAVVADGGHTSFRFSAAGRDSEVFGRLASELASATGLAFDPEEGELVLRVLPDPQSGWEVLARITPRPLSARPWRVCNLAGGLNATLAYGMLRLGGIKESDRVFNPMCGSGTLLIERNFLGPVERLVGADRNPAALTCAEENIKASKRGGIELAELDVVETELPARTFDLIVADLPWGDAVGTHEENARLYPAFLRGMAATGSRHARMVVLTHEIRLFEEVLDAQDRWTVRDTVRVYHGGHHPRMYLLSKG